MPFEYFFFYKPSLKLMLEPLFKFTASYNGKKLVFSLVVAYAFSFVLKGAANVISIHICVHNDSLKLVDFCLFFILYFRYSIVHLHNIIIIIIIII
ncbi:hypothetical protein IEQ34_016423 [Dendrobium chrysotoxum]|uniref:Uncharacterized protein n=1 Tax=Dendrobium chrysotoxum TaxID=161865 RepID=A0AAV7FY12_DENCH|nr:hypothetical protein IEQ34_016423 [Dendrobium chrysotoxum]